MRKIFVATACLLAWSGCGPEFEMRKEPDLIPIDPKRAEALRNIHVDRHYAARVSDRADWQVHTSLANRIALTDGDSATIATTTGEPHITEWIMIDLGCVCHFQNIRQVHPADGGQPPGYRIDTAGDRGFPFTLQFVGTGDPGESVATFPDAVDARFIRITVIDKCDTPWRVGEVEVF